VLNYAVGMHVTFDAFAPFSLARLKNKGTVRRSREAIANRPGNIVLAAPEEEGSQALRLRNRQKPECRKSTSCNIRSPFSTVQP
jgi:hypothetical protein